MSGACKIARIDPDIACYGKLLTGGTKKNCIDPDIACYGKLLPGGTCNGLQNFSKVLHIVTSYSEDSVLLLECVLLLS